MSIAPTTYWHAVDGGRVQCDVCPRACRLRAGQRGFCFVRENQGGAVVLSAYGRTSGLCSDPIEKKPLFHFLPGSSVLSFGTAGCNLGCRFCQNWDLTKSREATTLSTEAPPGDVARAAQELGCKSVAFTYNDPVVFLEYAFDTAEACRLRGVRTVAVTAGYVNGGGPREALFASVDAANVDLKGFTEGFYRRLASGRLAPVLETLRYVKRKTDVWLELTTLVIPGWNDGADELRAMCAWVVDELGPDVPMHFTAFHPAFRMLDVPPTPLATLRRARAIAKQAGVRHVYTGNVHDPEGESTWCHACGALLIERDGDRIGAWNLVGGACASCGARCAGVFAERAEDRRPTAGGGRPKAGGRRPGADRWGPHRRWVP